VNSIKLMDETELRSFILSRCAETDFHSVKLLPASIGVIAICNTELADRVEITRGKRWIRRTDIQRRFMASLYDWYLRYHEQAEQQQQHLSQPLSPSRTCTRVITLKSSRADIVLWIVDEGGRRPYRGGDDIVGGRWLAVRASNVTSCRTRRLSRLLGRSHGRSGHEQFHEMQNAI